MINRLDPHTPGSEVQVVPSRLYSAPVLTVMIASEGMPRGKALRDGTFGEPGGWPYFAPNVCWRVPPSLENGLRIARCIPALTGDLSCDIRHH